MGKQENETRRNVAHSDAMPSKPFVIEDNYVSPSIARQAKTPSSSPSSGLAFAIATLAKRQQMDRDSTNDARNVSNFDMLPISSGEERLSANSWVEVQQDNRRAVLIEGEDAKAGTSYSISDSAGETWDGAGD